MFRQRRFSHIAIIAMNYVVFKGKQNDTLCSLLQFNEENIFPMRLARR